MGSVTDPSGDANYSSNGSRTPAGSNLDLLGASLANGANRTLVATINVKSLSSLAVSSSVGGPDASWLIRWTVITPGSTGNGHIYYAGMDNNQGTGGAGSPTFFAGDTTGIPPNNPAEHTKYFAYPQTHVLNASQASYDKGTGVITLNIPLRRRGQSGRRDPALQRDRVHRHLGRAPVGDQPIQPHRRHHSVRARDRRPGDGRAIRSGRAALAQAAAPRTATAAAPRPPAASPLAAWVASRSV